MFSEKDFTFTTYFLYLVISFMINCRMNLSLSLTCIIAYSCFTLCLFLLYTSNGIWSGKFVFNKEIIASCSFIGLFCVKYSSAYFLAWFFRPSYKYLSNSIIRCFTSVVLWFFSNTKVSISSLLKPKSSSCSRNKSSGLISIGLSSMHMSVDMVLYLFVVHSILIFLLFFLKVISKLSSTLSFIINIPFFICFIFLIKIKASHLAYL